MGGMSQWDKRRLFRLVVLHCDGILLGLVTQIKSREKMLTSFSFASIARSAASSAYEAAIWPPGNMRLHPLEENLNH